MRLEHFVGSRTSGCSRKCRGRSDSPVCCTSCATTGTCSSRSIITGRVTRHVPCRSLGTRTLVRHVVRRLPAGGTEALF